MKQLIESLPEQKEDELNPIRNVIIQEAPNSQKENYNELSSEDMQLILYANFYHNLGMNITHIKGDKLNDKTYKQPTDLDWEKYITDEQSIEYINSQQWNDATGIGITLGYNQYRAIDIDDFVNPCEFPYFIQRCLNLLGLPHDYLWVIKSGGFGGHIIIKVTDIDNFETDTLAYCPNSGSYYSFYRMELRWCDHLVLPPSLHNSNRRYKFRNDEIPFYAPMKVSLNDLNSFINYFCGEEKFISCNYKNTKIYLVQIKKIGDDSASGNYLFNPVEDNINWLLKCDSDEALNSIGVAYALGRGVPFNLELAKSYFERAKMSPMAHFNLANLIACGAIYGDISDLDYHLQFCNNFSIEYLDAIRNNAKNIQVKKTPCYLFFDTETTGVPHDYKAPSCNVDNWPRLLQLGWILTDDVGEKISEKDYLVIPEGFDIPNEAVMVHGITNQKAKKDGLPLKSVIDIFMSDLMRADYIVGHNISFDKKIIGAEMIRLGQRDIMDTKKSYCTMESSINFCKIKNYYGYKYPKLQELYKMLFGHNFENAHNAFADITATAECFWAMRKKGLI